MCVRYDTRYDAGNRRLCCQDCCMRYVYSMQERHPVADSLLCIWSFVGIQIKRESKERQRMPQFHTMHERKGSEGGLLPIHCSEMPLRPLLTSLELIPISMKEAY
jgi:hypothetical protein